MSERALIETLALALVREYLAKKKYKLTLETLASELPVKPVPTTTTALARDLGISKFVSSNSKSEQPYATLLEIFADFMYAQYGRAENDGPAAATAEGKAPSVDRVSSKSSSGRSSSKSSGSSGSRRVEEDDDDLPRQFGRSSLNAAPSSAYTSSISSSSSRSGSTPSKSHAPVSPSSHSSPVASSSSSYSSSSSSRSGSRPDSGGSSASAASGGGFTSSANSSSRPGSASRTGRPSSSAIFSSSAASDSSMSSSKPSSASGSRSSAAAAHDSDLLVEEEVDFDEEVESYDARKSTSSSFNKPTAAGLSSGGSICAPFATTPVPPSSPVSLEAAHRAKSLIFGSGHLTGTFTDPWLSQGFFFKGADVTNKVPSLTFGLVQTQGGPCGMLAVVQAYIVKELLFGDKSSTVPAAKRYALLTPNVSTLHTALINALAEIVFTVVGEGRVARCCSKNPAGARMGSSRSMGSSGMFKPDGITECMQILELHSLAAVRNFFAVNLAHYMAPQGAGVVLFLYSVIFTRGVDKIMQDRDEASSLIGAHSYCTQEMVNLALTGRARSNVFNGTKDLGGMVLRGIDKRSTIGFLSLFEHYENICVESHLKSPLYPVWVICSESHYTVLFSLDASMASGTPPPGKFDLFYYDELAQQKEEIKLTIDTTRNPSVPAPREGDLEPPINDCIRTKWGKHARIDWNGVEPIL